MKSTINLLAECRRKILVLTSVLIGMTYSSLYSADNVFAISARASPDYHRNKAADGSFEKEYYVFGKGGYWSAGVRDKSIDETEFLKIAHTVAEPLSIKNYIPSLDPKNTKLLVMVYWGATQRPDRPSEMAAYQNLSDMSAKMSAGGIPVAHPGYALLSPEGMALDAELTNIMAQVQMENRIRDKTDRQNASMLGYDSWWDSTNGAQPATVLDLRRNDLLAELEPARYFVVLLAYDFQMLRKEKKKKLLWEARISIAERGNKFDEQLAAMCLAASKYVGQNTNGLVHTDVPTGSVHIGELKPVEEKEEKSK